MKENARKYLKIVQRREQVHEDCSVQVDGKEGLKSAGLLKI
jgi:hypothetical protein